MFDNDVIEADFTSKVDYNGVIDGFALITF